MGNGSYQMLIVCLLIALCPHMGEGCNNQGKKAKPKIWYSICSENDRNHAGREQDTPNCKGKTDYGYWKECREGQTYCVARLGPKPGNEWQRHCADKGFVEGLIAKHKENGTTRISGLRGRECADEEAIIAKRDEEFKKEMEDQAGGPHGTMHETPYYCICKQHGCNSNDPHSLIQRDDEIHDEESKGIYLVPSFGATILAVTTILLH